MIKHILHAHFEGLYFHKQLYFWTPRTLYTSQERGFYRL